MHRRRHSEISFNGDNIDFVAVTAMAPPEVGRVHKRFGKTALRSACRRSRGV